MLTDLIPGTVIAVHGRSLLDRMIEKESGPISHVGMVTAVGPEMAMPNGGPLVFRPVVKVTQAVMPRVATFTLEETIARAKYAYALTPLTIPKPDLDAIVADMLAHVGEKYDYADLLWQACDKATGTEWFTQHFATPGKTICSKRVAMSFGTKGYTFGVARRSATPSEIFEYAVEHPQDYSVRRL
jgi:hypothetical protein